MVDQQRLQSALHMFASTLVRRYEVGDVLYGSATPSATCRSRQRCTTVSTLSGDLVLLDLRPLELEFQTRIGIHAASLIARADSGRYLAAMMGAAGVAL